MSRAFAVRKYTPKQVAEAKRLYFTGGYTYSEIAHHTGINRSTVRYYINAHWRDEKEADNSILRDAFVQSIVADLPEISMMTSSLVRDTITSIKDKMENEGRIPTAKELKTLVDMVKTLANVTYIEQDRASKKVVEAPEAALESNIEEGDIEALDPFSDTLELEEVK